jgi:tetratricopeptide (TPR) repeat protein
MSIMSRRFSFAVLLGGLLLLSATGCGSSNPNVSAAEDALENDNFEQALQSINAEIQASPQNAEAYRIKGDILYQQAQGMQAPERRAELLGEARAAYESAVERDPSLEGQVDVMLLRAYQNEFRQGAAAYNRADSLGDDDGFRESAAYFEGAALLQPDSSRASVLASNAYLNAGDYDRAVEPLERTVEMGQAGAGTYTTLGQLYLRDERYDEAIATFEEASEAYPDDENLRSQRLTAYARSGDMERAETAYGEAVRESPDNAALRLRYGSMLLQQDRYDEAIEQLERATELNPADPNALFNLGAAYTNKSIPLSERIRAMDEERSARSDELSDQELREMDEEIQALIEEQSEMFSQAIDPLERAREALSRGESNSSLSEQQICSALYTAYVRTNQTEKAQQVQTCAGLSD